MASQVRRDDVVIVAEPFRYPVPVPAMITPTVDEQECWSVFVTPVHIVQAQSLGVVGVRSGAFHRCFAWYSIKGAHYRPGFFA